jgi:hypothetical protein
MTRTEACGAEGGASHHYRIDPGSPTMPPSDERATSDIEYNNKGFRRAKENSMVDKPKPEASDVPHQPSSNAPPSAAPEQRPAEPLAATAVLAAARQFENTQRSYWWASYAARQMIGRRYERAYRDYLSAEQSATAECQRKSAQTYENLLRALDDSARGPNPKNFLSTVYHEHYGLVNQLRLDKQKSIETAYVNYLSALRELRIEGELLERQNYRDYLRTLQDVWTRLDADAIAIETVNAWVGGAP